MSGRRAARRSATVAGGTLILVGIGAAFAAWTTSGSGSATAQAGTAQPLTTSAAAVTTGLLYPSGPAGDVRITVVNPNPFPVRVSQINGNGAITASGGTGTCATHGVTYTNQSGTWDVAAGSSATFTLTGAASMAGTSENGCQGATFTIPVTLVGTSN